MRDHKGEVGSRALPGFIQVLQDDADIDPDMGKAVLETLNVLCEVDNASKEKEHEKELGLRHMDYFLHDEQSSHPLFKLLGNSQLYVRFTTLQLLSTGVHNRCSVVQSTFSRRKMVSQVHLHTCRVTLRACWVFRMIGKYSDWTERVPV